MLECNGLFVIEMCREDLQQPRRRVVHALLHLGAAAGRGDPAEAIIRSSGPFTTELPWGQSRGSAAANLPFCTHGGIVVGNAAAPAETVSVMVNLQWKMPREAAGGLVRSQVEG